MIKKIYKLCDFSKENNPDKNYLQQLLYSLSKVKGSATIVSGIAVERHIHDFEYYIQIKKSKLNLVEINKDIYNRIVTKCKSLNKSYVSVLNCNIINAPLYRFVDAGGRKFTFTDYDNMYHIGDTIK